VRRNRWSKRAMGGQPFVWLIGWLGAVLLRALGASWRCSIEGDNPLRSGAPPILGVFWHRNMLIGAYLFRDRGYGVPVSRSRDGELIASVLRRLGYSDPPRGSSTRGGAAALRALARLVSAGTTVSIQTDGPRGPARRSKPGVVALARLTGADIVAIGFSASPCLRFRSWDGTLLPLPFARVVCRFEAHFPVPADSTPEREAEVLAALDHALNRTTDELDDRMGLRGARGSKPVGP